MGRRGSGPVAGRTGRAAAIMPIGEMGGLTEGTGDPRPTPGDSGGETAGGVALDALAKLRDDSGLWAGGGLVEKLAKPSGGGLSRRRSASRWVGATMGMAFERLPVRGISGGRGASAARLEVDASEDVRSGRVCETRRCGAAGRGGGCIRDLSADALPRSRRALGRGEERG